MRALLAVVLAAAASAQTPAGLRRQTSDAAVHIDVIAVDAAGRPVDNLRAADFDLREDGTPQSIDEVRFVKVDGGALDPSPPIGSPLDERTEAGSPNTRLIAIFLDDYHVSGGVTTERVRAALRRFVDLDLGPRDLVTVLRPLDSLLTIRLTRDRDAIRRVIDTFDGRKGDYAPRSPFEQEYMANAPARIEDVRAQVTMSALSALAIHLGSLGAARKTLVLVSEGLPRAPRRRGFEPLPTFESVVGAANRSNVSIYAVNPQEIPARDAGDAPVLDTSQEVLRALAAQTNGDAIVTPTDLDSGMRRIVGDSSAYYLLTYHSERNQDGKFHEVSVRVNRPDVRVRARKGYWASTPGELMRANMLAHALDPPPVRPLEPARRISPLVRPWFGVARGSGGKTRVTFVWEPVEHVPGDRTARSPARVVLTALGADDRALFEGPVLPVGPAGPEPREETAVRAVFDAPPGQLRLRMSIEDAADRAIDSDVRDIAIRDLRAPVALGTPEVLRARTARDFRGLVADPEAVPVASREFSRAERLIIRFPAYAPGPEQPTVSAKLLSRAGGAMRDLPVESLAAPDSRNQIDLPLASLAAGEYQLEIILVSPAGKANELMVFRVTS